ncbi:hypothetical protein E2C01_066745 [Portunus trituberculatus]|uniref:Uncharacterized protein n=1 Tax=Portunus trituberculatus TaxID=210409 RepID=A0A5B7HIZ9_PORTR|nr:hypothetical protein [Portunus trituberculatus]
MEHFLLQYPRLLSQHTALRFRLSTLAITTLNLSSWRSQAYTFPSNLLSFALLVPSSGRLASYHACDTHTGQPQGS